MMQVALCITQQHDLRLVFVALLVCLIGSAATVQLFGRILSASGPSRVGWVMLTAVSTGTMVWSTHFVAMMAFRTQAPVVLDPILTLASLVLAIAVAAPGLALAATKRRWAAAAGGAIIGIAISTMHYLGMSAYRIDGFVTWDWRYVVASVVLSSLLAAAAFQTVIAYRRAATGHWAVRRHVVCARRHDSSCRDARRRMCGAQRLDRWPYPG